MSFLTGTKLLAPETTGNIDFHNSIWVPFKKHILKNTGFSPKRVPISFAGAQRGDMFDEDSAGFHLKLVSHIDNIDRL